MLYMNRGGGGGEGGEGREVTDNFAFSTGEETPLTVSGRFEHWFV